MLIRVITIGKTHSSYLKEGIADYQARLKHYGRFKWLEIATPKNLKPLKGVALMEKEGKLLLDPCQPGDRIFLFDEGGKQYNSREFAGFTQKQMNSGVKAVNFLVGGAYGFSDEVKSRADGKVSLSPMTFSHQLVRLIIAEQIYRAHTIIKGEPYHHD